MSAAFGNGPKVFVWKPGSVSADSMTGGVLKVLLPKPLSGVLGGMKSTVSTFGCGRPLPPKPPSNRATPSKNGTVN